MVLQLTPLHDRVWLERLIALQVSGGLALRLFWYEELELLICGLPHLDFAGLKSAAQCEGGYSADHPTIVQFWEVVMALTFEQKKSFLRFCTGCDRCVKAASELLHAIK